VADQSCCPFTHRLCAAQLREMQAKHPGKPLVWVDIGGGTGECCSSSDAPGGWRRSSPLLLSAAGWNIEQMAEYFPLEELSQIYLIDLCEPLLEVARQRFRSRGWKNVQVLCQDAAGFTLPGLQEEQKVDLFTCSYSISMVSKVQQSRVAATRRSDASCTHRSRPSMPCWTASMTCWTLTPASLE
jgi:betaine lipid synthase